MNNTNEKDNQIVQDKFEVTGVDPVELYGLNDTHIDSISKNFNSKITARGAVIFIEGDSYEVKMILNLLSELVFLLNRNKKLDSTDVETAIRISKTKYTGTQRKEELNSVVVFTEDGSIQPKTRGQKRYCEASKNNDIVFVIGPAGTGKTYLAVAIAISYLKSHLVKRIIISRPAVEAGESLGFLPGDLREKVDPYLKPLYDALQDIVPAGILKRYFENQVIEIVPLAYMRGRTLNNSFVILDEAQNSSAVQMKMFLTRLGVNSKAIITGDITQIDLANRRQSGLVQIQPILNRIDGIEFIYMKKEDIVRHKLVKDIIKAYDDYDRKVNGSSEKE